MATVVSRTFRSIPHRSADQTWLAIVDLLAQNNSTARTELLSISGIAASIIADKSPQDSPIVVLCDGPRTRIYCAYDDDAIEDDNGNENPLGFDPLQGNWSISLPCSEDDLNWVQQALSTITKRITAREQSSSTLSESNEEKSNESKSSLKIDQKGFLGI